ncbi:MAG: SIMPL domain-containing protein [Vulcanimicrobiaceae bacterium]
MAVALSACARRAGLARALAALALPAIALAPCALRAQPAPYPGPTITVVGRGNDERPPDLARLSISIITDDADAAASASANQKIFDTLRAKLEPLGLGPDALHVTFFVVNFIPYPPKGLPPEQRQGRYGYVTTRTLSLDVSPVEKAGSAVDAALAAGATNVSAVQYALRDPESAYRTALAAAMRNAQLDAGALAAAAGLHVGELRSISASENTVPVFARVGMFAASMPAPVAPTELGPTGPIATNAVVTVVYVLR